MAGSVDTMSAFVQVAEVWMQEGSKLVLQSGAFGGHARFGEVSAGASFRFGEGLPGSVWSSTKPQIWDDLQRSHFVRIREAAQAGLHAAVGLPVAAGGHATNAVVVLLCGSPGETGGCIERWDVAPDGRELRHAGGYYGMLEPFARMSPRMRFQLGHGLPGITAKRGLPTIIEDTRASDSFLRADVARECGVEAGVGIPIYRHGEVAHVVVLLSATATPLARAFEVWVPSHSDVLKLDAAFYTRGLEAFGDARRETKVKVGHGLAGRVFQTELPHVESALRDGVVHGAAAHAAGLTVGVAIPVSDGRRMLAAVVLLS